MLDKWTSQFARINDLVSTIAQEISMDFDQLASLWVASVTTYKPSQPSLWNAYQRYFRDPNLGGTERQRHATLMQQQGQVLSVTDNAQISICFADFRTRVTNWEEILRTVNEYSPPKHITFERGRIQVEQLLDQLQRNGIDGAVVLASERRNHTYETKLAKGFFLEKCRANPEMAGHHLGTHRMNQLSLQTVRISWKDKFQPVIPPASKTKRSHSSVSPSKLKQLKLPDLLRTIYHEDVGSMPARKGFPWLNLESHLIANSLYLDGYPSEIPYPKNTPGNNGCNGLRADQKMALHAAIDRRKSTNPSHGLRFRPYSGNPLDYKNGYVALIRSRDAHGRTVKSLYAGGRVEYMSESPALSSRPPY
ncbi:hypothetical protein C8R43DRAFT_1120798 [Mycena crocata]|nr:hypothetical protein C8R43DRAFT_1120798 [Mycena crocata]